MIRPLNDFIIIQPKEVDEKTTAGIILMPQSKEAPQTGIVISVGRGRITSDGNAISPNVNVGDEVIYTRYAGTEIADGNGTLLLLREMDILAIIE